ncbi:Heterokaryon incompatibility protein (HET) domain containing protein [Rhypophila sp. PSN 637]
MPYITFSENFYPHRTLHKGRLIIKPELRLLYPYHIGKLRYPDYDQDEHPRENVGVKVDKIKEWLKQCDNMHGYHCHRSPGDHTGGPSLLIDVKRKCLVRAERHHDYLALSYVWGEASCVSLSSDTKDRLSIEGSLEREKPPKTISQAMELAALLGQTYLWVDRLCIVQDDGPTKKTQIASMANIYANSYLTIVAAESDDVSKPLCPRGFGKTWSDSDHDSPPSPTSPRSCVMHDLSFDLVTSSAWSTRGWTFQEYHSSRRKLIFHRNTVTWECHCEAWNEMEDHQSIATTRQCQAIHRSPSSMNSTGLNLSSWPDFHLFARLVCHFNVRHLTYQSDTLDAIEGLLSVFSTVFEGGFISGLPQMIFDAALLWQPYFPMQRREEQGSRANDPRIPPTWSYFGHYGSIHSEDLVAASNWTIHEGPDMPRLPATHTISTVEWSHSVSRDGPRIPIVVSAAGYRERYQGRHEDLPPGWHAMGSSTNYMPCRHRRRRRSINSDLVQYFWHDSIDDAAQRFWYPVPIRPPNSPPSVPSHRPRFLHGNTRVIAGMGMQIVMFDAQHGKDNHRRCADAFIRIGQTGEWIGYIRLNQSADSMPGSTAPKSSREGKENNTTDEHVVQENSTLIELSRGSTTYDERLLDRYAEYLYPEMAREKVIPPMGQVYEFVNVMWIETLPDGGGVATRKAVGRVTKAAWARLSRGDFDVSIF